MRAASALSPMLQRLASERATGALMRDRGTLYLADGQVVHAESPATPGIDILLTTSGTLHRDGWWDAVAQAGAGQRVGRYLVDSGRIPGGALELCHLGALYDAAFFALAPPGPRPGSVTGSRTGSVPCTPSPSMPCSARRSGAGSCSTGSGPTR